MATKKDRDVGDVPEPNTVGVGLGKINAVGDLQGGIEEAERLLGYKVILAEGPAEVEPRRGRSSPSSRPTRRNR